MLRQGARQKGGTVLIVHVRLQAIVASLVMLPNKGTQIGLKIGKSKSNWYHLDLKYGQELVPP